MDSKGVWLIAPPVHNFSCSHPRYAYSGSLVFNIGIGEVIQASFILCLALGIIGANLIVIFVINNRRYSPYIHPQPRYLLTSLALNDLAIGILITPFAIVSALLHCWAFGEVVCQIQALLRGALSQQSAVILVCMAVDRYMCVLYPRKYHKHSSKKGCVAILSVTWVICLTVYGLLVLPKGYYFNATGLVACEPFYSKPSYRILSTCALYFPTTMVLMYCYGSSFHASRFRLSTAPSITEEQQCKNSVLIINPQKSKEPDQGLSGSTSRTMAAMSLAFIVMVTPWTIQEVVAACTGSKVPPFLDFFVTWTSMSYSFWNPFLYWLLNAHFRRISRDLISSKCFFYEKDLMSEQSRCCSFSSEFDPITTVPIPPGPPKQHPPRPDIEEMYWGEILERTLSSNSLHALQRSYGVSYTSQNLNRDASGSTKEICLKSPKSNPNNDEGLKTTARNIQDDGDEDVEEEEDSSDEEAIEEMDEEDGEGSSLESDQQQVNRVSFMAASDTQLFEYSIHDKNCAKTKAFKAANHSSINGHVSNI